ncbi:MAG: hypothetical protein JNK63_01180 [Chthonomonas sp.]|nr:hypothetical protein [Chthonomonas sp.]
MTKLTTAFVLSGISASIAFAQTSLTPEVLFADNFESNSLANWPSTTVSGTLTAVSPSTVSASPTDHVFEGQYSCKIPGRSGAPTGDPLRNPRISYGALFTRQQTNDETLVFTQYMYDQYGGVGVPTSGTDGIGSQRFFTALRQGDGVNPFSAVSQIVTMGNWNAFTTNFGTGFVNNCWFGTANPSGQSIGNHYAGRILSVAPGSGFVTGTTTLELGGITAPSWTYFGVGADYRRTNGWHKFTIVYNVRRVEFYVDRRLFGYWDINPNLTGTARQLNTIILNPTLETPAQDTWVDNMKVRAFPNGSMQVIPVLGDVVNPSAAQTVPFSLELVPINGNTNNAVSTWTANMNADGEINVGFPNDVRGEYQLVIDGGSWLKKKVNINLTETGLFEFKVPMQNGDPDGSGEVDAADIDLVIANFGGTGVGPNNGDVDLSDEVDAADIDVVIANFGGIDD